MAYRSESLGHHSVTAMGDLENQGSPLCRTPRKSPPFEYKPRTYTLDEFKRIFVNGSSNGDL